MDDKQIGGYEIALVLLLLLLITLWFFKPTEKAHDNSVILVTEQGEIKEQDSQLNDSHTGSGVQLDFNYSAENETEITQYVATSISGFSGLPITSYKLQSPLLPKARLLNFREFNNRLWFAGNTGLYSFDLTSEQWFIKTREHGLPRDTAYGIERIDNGLLLKLLDWTKENHLGNNLNAEFDGDRFLKSTLRDITAKNNGRPIPNLEPLKGPATDYQQVDGIDWYCVRGNHISREKGFDNGGVIKFDPKASKRTVYTKKQGLLTGYCTSIAATSDNTIWASHWDEEIGLSHLTSNNTEWQVKESSANGIPLGGPSLYAIGEFLFIAQQRALVIYDPLTDMAIEITEELGLAGFIVTDIQHTKDGRVWATSYRYASEGNGQAGAGLVSFKLSDVSQLFKQENLERSLRNSRTL